MQSRYLPAPCVPQACLTPLISAEEACWSTPQRLDWCVCRAGHANRATFLRTKCGRSLQGGGGCNPQ
eukprot:1514852-Alexandrium_andersonii.AAC.1